MFSVVFCQAEQDLELARKLGEYLEANLPASVSYDEGLIRPGRDLIEAAGCALSAEVAVVVLSPDSVPARWDRARWEPALLRQPGEFGSQLLFVLARPCQFPELLKRDGFADATAGLLAAQRDLKRHIMRRRNLLQDAFPVPRASAARADFGALESLRTEVADRPGLAVGIERETALAFAHAYKDDFEGAFWIECAYRTPAGVAGETGAVLGLPLTGSLDQNRTALREFCEARRCLFVYEHLEPEQAKHIGLGGKSSAIVMAASPLPALPSVVDAISVFSHWTQNLDRCGEMGAGAYLQLQGLTNDWPKMSRLGLPVIAFLKNAGRLAEADEALSILIAGAKASQDGDALHRLEWDRSWIHGHWGEPYGSVSMPSQGPAEPRQLGLGFV